MKHKSVIKHHCARFLTHDIGVCFAMREQDDRGETTALSFITKTSRKHLEMNTEPEQQPWGRSTVLIVTGHVVFMGWRDGNSVPAMEN